MTKHQDIRWTIQATPAVAISHVLEAAKALKFKATAAAEGQVLLESPFSLRTNTFAGKYTGTVIADAETTTVIWAIEGQGTNQPKNLQKLAEKLPAELLTNAASAADSNAATESVPVGIDRAQYRAKHGIPDDAVLAIGVGGFCVFDGHFLTIQTVGLAGRLTVGKGVKRIPLASVSAVQIKPAGTLVNGFIQFTLPGSNERRSEFGRQTLDAAGDENSVVFPRSQEPSFLAFRDALEQAIVARHSPGAPAAGASPPSVLDQISQLGSLRDAGILTPEEFEAKKAELLSRI